METLSDFFRDLARAGRGLLMLDYDGTLAPFRVERDKATPYKGVREALTAIARDGRTRLVVVSGRPVAEILSLLALRDPPEIWGCHGWQRRHPDGRQEDVRPDGAAREGLARAWEVLERAGLSARSEHKTAAVALHWRGESERDVRAIRDAVRGHWQALAGRETLELLEFAGGLEIRATGRDKGSAVRTLLAEQGGEVVAAYLGDDATDEDAFLAIRGRGLAVLVAERPRRTSANCLLRPPTELLAFLDRWRRALAGPAGDGGRDAGQPPAGRDTTP